MNKHFTEPLTTRQREGLAFLSLAKSQRRLSWVSRRWALEDAEKGDADKYRHHAADAKRLWRAAKYHLQTARRMLTNG